jgi:hypothetical protein
MPKTKVVKVKKPKRPETDPIELSVELDKMDNNSQRHINIIALYIREKKLKPRNYGQLQAIIVRHTKAAALLRPFDDDQILQGIVKARKSMPEDWTIETIIKMVTK